MYKCGHFFKQMKEKLSCLVANGCLSLWIIFQIWASLQTQKPLNERKVRLLWESLQLHSSEWTLKRGGGAWRRQPVREMGNGGLRDWGTEGRASKEPFSVEAGVLALRPLFMHVRLTELQGWGDNKMSGTYNCPDWLVIGCAWAVLLHSSKFPWNGSSFHWRLPLHFPSPHLAPSRVGGLGTKEKSEE